MVYRAISSSFVLAYGSAHAAKSLIWHMSELMFAFFLTEALSLPPAYVGLVLAVSMLVNAVLDFAAGWAWHQRITTTLAAARLQLFGAVAVAITLVGFASVIFAPETHRPFLAAVSTLLFRIAYPLLDNPQNSILAFATIDDGGRARLASLRYIMGGSSKLVLAALFAPVMIDATPMEQGYRFWFLCVILGAIVIVASACLFRAAQVNPFARVVGEFHRPDVATFDRVSILSAATLFTVAIVLSAFSPVFSKLMPYFSAFAIRDLMLAGMVLSAAAFGSLVAQFGWASLAQRWSLVAVLRTALSLTLIGAAMFLALAPIGGLGAVGSALIYGGGLGGVLMSVWALLARLASSTRTPLRGTAAFGLYTCCSKIGHAISAGVVGLILAGLDYRTPSVAAGPLVFWMAVVPAFGLAIIALLTHRLGKDLADSRNQSSDVRTVEA